MQGGRRPSCWKREVGGPLAYGPLRIAQIFVLSLGLHLVSILVRAIVGDISRGHSCPCPIPCWPPSRAPSRGGGAVETIQTARKFAYYIPQPLSSAAGAGLAPSGIVLTVNALCAIRTIVVVPLGLKR